jgi:hypothetical protein
LKPVDPLGRGVFDLVDTAPGVAGVITSVVESPLIVSAKVVAGTEERPAAA